MSPVRTAPPLLPYLLLIVTVFFWGTAFRATAIGADAASPVVFSTLRALPAAVLLLALLPITKGRLPRGIPLRWAGISGLLMVTLTFEGIAEGTKLAGAGNAAVLVNTTPFFVLIIGRAFLGERIASFGIIGLVTAFTGVVVMISSQIGGGGETADVVVGMSVALLSGAGFAVGTLLAKATTTRFPDTDLVGFAAVQHLVGGAALIPLALLYGNIGGTQWSSGDLWVAVAWVSIGSSAIASVAYFTALRYIPATRGSSWQFLAPVVAVIVEIGRGNAPEAIVLGGMTLVIFGVAVVNRAPTTDAAPPPPPQGHLHLQVEPGLAGRPAAIDGEYVPRDH